MPRLWPKHKKERAKEEPSSTRTEDPHICCSTRSRLSWFLHTPSGEKWLGETLSALEGGTRSAYDLYAYLKRSFKGLLCTKRAMYIMPSSWCYDDNSGGYCPVHAGTSLRSRNVPATLCLHVLAVQLSSGLPSHWDQLA